MGQATFPDHLGQRQARSPLLTAPLAPPCFLHRLEAELDGRGAAEDRNLRPENGYRLQTMFGYGYRLEPFAVGR